MKSLFLVLFLLGLSLAAYDADEALHMAYASGLAYCNTTNILARNCGNATEFTEKAGMDILHVADNGKGADGITYVVLKRDQTKDLVVSFSGTKDAEQLIKEILEAFNIDYSIHPEVPGAKVFDYFLEHYVDGFRDDFMSAMPGILSQYPSYDVIFTGHSLGGALTVHAAADFVLSNMQGGRKVRIYTFGQPRVGNPAFADAIHGNVTEWYRLVHNNDLVPHIPPCISDLHDSCVHDGPLPFYPYHAPEEIHYDEPFVQFTACSLSNGEDPSCSDGQSHDSTTDHTFYFNLSVSTMHIPDDSTNKKVYTQLHSE